MLGSIPGQHLHWRLARPQALVVFVGLWTVPALVELAALLAADDNRHRPLADGHLRVHLVGLHEIDLSGTNQQISAAPDLSVVRPGAIVEALAPLDPLLAVEHAI